jgi:hypothetical protein
VFVLYDNQLIQSYIGGIKPHIQDDSKLHEVTTIEIARQGKSRKRQTTRPIKIRQFLFNNEHTQDRKQRK